MKDTVFPPQFFQAQLATTSPIHLSSQCLCKCHRTSFKFPLFEKAEDTLLRTPCTVQSVLTRQSVGSIALGTVKVSRLGKVSQIMGQIWWPPDGFPCTLLARRPWDCNYFRFQAALWLWKSHAHMSPTRSRMVAMSGPHFPYRRNPVAVVLSLMERL